MRKQSSSSKESVGPLGAWLDPQGGARFRVWAPEHERLDLVEHDAGGAQVRTVALTREPGGAYSLHLPEAAAGFLYKYRIDGEGPFPDPWSRAQPLGVHGPSQVISDSFRWTDAAWPGVAMQDLVIYEVHVGTATPEGTFTALIPRLKALREEGITALELMPLHSFPGQRNWGYDGVTLNAPQQSYGGPEGLRRLVDAAHAEGLGVLVDVVYNHFGPDGNYLRCYASHYFTGRHHTPWGEAVNYDGERSAPVRELALRNAEMWIRDYHADGLRLDAVHAIIDESPTPLVQALAERARSAAPGRQVVVIAEDERNDPRLVTPVERGGFGLDGVWADDLHHQLRRAFAGDRDGYYADYTGSAADLARTLERGWFYEGQPRTTSGQPRGKPAQSVEPWRLVHCIQNHDQVGNRARGDRLGESVSAPAYRAMSTVLLLSPYTPLLFMGQEWNASAPFLYFTDHHPELGRLVTEGRRREFEHFERFGGSEEVPDPQALATFERSRPDWVEREKSGHAEMLALYRELLRLRQCDPRLQSRARGRFTARAVGEHALMLERRGDGSSIHVLVNVRGRCVQPLPANAQLMLWTEHPRYGGALERPVVHDGTLELDGPCALVLSVAT